MTKRSLRNFLQTPIDQSNNRSYILKYTQPKHFLLGFTSLGRNFIFTFHCVIDCLTFAPPTGGVVFINNRSITFRNRASSTPQNAITLSATASFEMSQPSLPSFPFQIPCNFVINALSIKGQQVATGRLCGRGKTPFRCYRLYGEFKGDRLSAIYRRF